jgi:hypothetical protein
MAQASFRAFVGIAKDGNNASLQIAHAGGAIALTLRSIVQVSTVLTAAGATYSAVIVDGTLTETVACSGNLSATTDGATIACAGLAHAHTANAYVYFQLTASIGPTAYIPVTDPGFADLITQLEDTSFSGSNAQPFSIVQGNRTSEVTLAGNVYPDSFGYILSNFMGAYDYVATSGGNPTTYAFSPNNQSNGQPTSYLYYVYNPGGANCRVFAGAAVEELGVKADPGAFVSWTAKIQAFASGVVATPTASYSAFTALAGRLGTVTVAGTASPKFVSLDITLKRDQSGPIPTFMGRQDPLDIFVGAAVVSGTFTVITDDDVQLLNYLNGSQPAVTLSMLQGATTAVNGIVFQMTKCNYDSGTKANVKGKGWVELTVPFKSVANTTDISTAGGGRSPVLATLSTGTTTGAAIY